MYIRSEADQQIVKDHYLRFYAAVTGFRNFEK